MTGGAVISNGNNSITEYNIIDRYGRIGYAIY